MVPLARPFANGRELELVDEVLRSGVLDHGPMLDRFEQRFAHVVGSRHAIAATSAATALQLVAATSGWGNGDELVASPCATVASATMTRLLGVGVTCCDLDPVTLGIDVDALERVVGDRTRGIIAQDAFGWPVDHVRLTELAASRDAVAIVDVGGALAASGPVSVARLFTLSADVELTTGTGAVLCTDDDATAGAWRELAARASFDCRLGDVPAAVGMAQLERLPRTIALRELVAGEYLRLLERVDGIELPPARHESIARTWPRFWVLVDAAIERDRVRMALANTGIETGIPRVDRASLESAGLAVAADVAARALALPCFPQLSPQQQERVVASLADVVEGV